MGNQYSITVSEESHNILNHLKREGHLVSRLVDVAVRTLGSQGLVRLVRMQKAYQADFEEALE